MAYQLFKVNLPKTRDQSPIHFGLALSLPKGEVWRGGQNTKTNTEGAGVYAELAEALWFCFWRELWCSFWRAACLPSCPPLEDDTLARS